jgi:type II restriction enzyme
MPKSTATIAVSYTTPRDTIKIPESGKIDIVRNGVALPKNEVLEQWQRTRFLRDVSQVKRSWLVEIMKCVDILQATEFSLSEMYACESHLALLFPGNSNVRPKIRQQLQLLRDNGYLDFIGRGRYRLNNLI